VKKSSFIPIIYDFKRSFFRVSTLALLIVFIVAGIGLSYSEYHLVSSELNPIKAIGLMYINNTKYFTVGMIYNTFGNPINDVKIELVGSKGHIIKSEKVNSEYKLFGYSNIIPTKLIIIYKGKRIVEQINYVVNNVAFVGSKKSLSYRIGIYSPSNSFIGPEVHSFTSLGYVTNRTYRNIYVLIDFIMLDKTHGYGMLQMVSIGGIPLKVPKKPNVDIGYAFTTFAKINKSTHGFYFTTMSSGKSYNLTYKHLVTLKDYFYRSRIHVNSEKDILALKFNSRNTTTYELINYDSLQPINALTASVILSSGGLTVFLNFFPILILYLAYVLMAKPRSTGAMEFIITRPVTRWDIYLVRYVSPVLVVILSSALFVIALNVTNTMLLGLGSDLYMSALIFISLIAALTAWYSFCYMLASGMRNSSGYLALSIIFYIIFAMFWNLIVYFIAYLRGIAFSTKAFQELSYKLAFLNPIGMGHLVLYYLREHYRLIKPISWMSPEIVTIAILVWIVIPFIIGYLTFKKD